MNYSSVPKLKLNRTVYDGKLKDSYGYIHAYLPDHPRANSKGYVREHIAVWEEHHGHLPSGYEVHHINHIKSDNRIENLIAMLKSDHIRQHYLEASPDMELLSDLYINKRLGIRAISRITGISEPKIYFRLLKYGVKMRGKNETHAIKGEPCLDCGRPTSKKRCKGRCASCYAAWNYLQRSLVHS